MPCACETCQRRRSDPAFAAEWNRVVAETLRLDAAIADRARAAAASTLTPREIVAELQTIARRSPGDYAAVTDVAADAIDAFRRSLRASRGPTLRARVTGAIRRALYAVGDALFDLADRVE